MTIVRYAPSCVLGAVLSVSGASGLVTACADPRFDGDRDAALDAGPEASSPAPDTGPVMDAGAVANDGALPEDDQRDVSEPDDSQVGPPAPCLDDPTILGGECPNVVNCTSLGLCDLSRNLCCVTQTTASCQPALNCNGQQRFRCDGPEDCPGGAVCCLSQGATTCVEASACAGDDYRVCHVDSDCEGRRCLEGVPGMFGPFGVLYFAGAGVCRGL